MDNLVSRIRSEGGYFFYLHGGLPKLKYESDEQASTRNAIVRERFIDGRANSYEVSVDLEYYIAGYNLIVPPSVNNVDQIYHPLAIGLRRGNILNDNRAFRIDVYCTSNEQLIYGPLAKESWKSVPGTRAKTLTGFERITKALGFDVKTKYKPYTDNQRTHEDSLSLNEIVRNGSGESAHFLLFNFHPAAEGFLTRSGRKGNVAQVMIATNEQLCSDVVGHLTQYPEHFVPLAIKLFPKREFPVLNEALVPSIKPRGQLRILHLPIDTAVFGNYGPQEVAKLTYGK